MIKCEKCKLEFGNNGSFVRHHKDCFLDEDIIKSIIKDYNESELTIRQIRRKYGITYLKLRSLFSFYEVKMRNLSTSLRISKCEKRNHTDESKKKISDKRKIYLKSNPDKHPWRNKDKFISPPCEKLKSILDDMGINYISEFLIDGRNFSLDIAIPDKKISIEVNGNQHYNSDGSLKEYYQDRHEYLTSLGWTVHELHYSIPYSKLIRDIVLNIFENKESIYDFDYDQYLKTRVRKITVKKCHCGKIILPTSNSCRTCSNPSTKRPEKKVLEKDIKNLGYSSTGRKYKVSPTTIRRWEKKYL